MINDLKMVEDQMIEKLKELIVDLEKVDTLNNDEFKTMVDKSITVLSIDVRDMADEFETAVATITRWRTGITTPMKGVKAIVLKYLIKLASERLEKETSLP